MGWDKVMPSRPVVAVAGATGAVGVEMLKVLEQRDFPADRVIALASARSAGKRVPFRGGELVVEEMTPASFSGVDIALFSAGAGVSKAFRDAVTGAGAVMIDASGALERGVLVVPEVNAEVVAEQPAGRSVHRGTAGLCIELRKHLFVVADLVLTRGRQQ